MADAQSHGAPFILNDADASTDTADTKNPWISTSSPEHGQSNIMQPQTSELFVPQMDSSEVATSDPSVLKEFDPVEVDPVEKHAREAWESAEGHPPPPALPMEESLNSGSTTSVSPSPPSLAPPPKEDTISVPSSQQSTPQVPQSAPALSSTFPSLASLARTLTRSPRRSVTPPLPLPPRTYSLHHAHHSSLSSLPSNHITSASLPTTNSDPQAMLARDEERRIATTSSDDVRSANSPKPDGQFDFQKFLDQMKTKGADPIAKYLRSFLSNFAKKTFAVNDQIKIIHDFLSFISDKMRTMDGSPWQQSMPQDFDNAMEAMEKLVMNRLYEFTFQPLLPPSLRTTDDLERDHVLRQRISLFGWLREEHLDVPLGGKDGQGGKEIKGFLEFAQQELLKMNHYKAPRDKLICILNCCKVIFGLIRHVNLSEGADSFIPILIFVVLKANPEHLLSNVEYINRFRNPNKLQSEAGYYLSSLMGAVSFIETMDHSSLSNISQEEFERNVEAAVENLPMTRTPSPPSYVGPQTPRTPNISGTPIPTPPRLRPSPSPLAGEEAARPLSLPMPSSSDGPANGVNPEHPDSAQMSLAEDTRRFFQRTSDTISKPLAAIGRIFSDVLDESGISSSQGNSENSRKVGWRDLPGPFAPLSVGNQEPHRQQPQVLVSHWSHPDQVRQHDVTQQAPHTPLIEGQPPIQTPYKPRVRPAYTNSPANSYRGPSPGTDYTPSPSPGAPLASQPLTMEESRQPSTLAPHAVPVQRYLEIASPHPSRNPTPTLDFGALQDEIDRAHVAAQDAARATLMQIFPTVDREVAEMVLEANNGDLGRSIESLLEISTGEPQDIVR